MADAALAAAGREERAGRGRAAFALMVVLTGVALAMVPWSERVLEPCHLAAIAALVSVAIYAWQRFTPRPRVWWEVLNTAAFLAAMPFVYVARYAFYSPRADASALALELLGVGVYVGLAVLGLTRSPWFLALGIAAHGLGWDAWHFRHSAYVPDWYAIACLILDVGVGAYAATRAPLWRRR